LKSTVKKAVAARMRAARLKACEEAIMLQQERRYNRMRDSLKQFLMSRVKQAQVKTAQEAITMIN
jgi:hypothetical protein